MTDVQLLLQKVEAASSQSEAYAIVGDYLTQISAAVTRPPFAYKASFAKSAPGCRSNFVRGFTHRDWRDGQDLVQAEQSAGEDGFNFRFHQIEKDLDALHADIQGAFTCLADQRAALADLLNELKTEINLINLDIGRLQDCCRKQSDVVLTRDDIVEGKFLGGVNWFGKSMHVFATSKGTVLLPKVGPVDGGDGPGDPRIKRVVALGEILEVHKELSRAFRDGPVSRETLIRDFGGFTTDDGVTLKDTLTILAPDSVFASGVELLTAVADREAAAIRTGGRTDRVLTTQFGGRTVVGAVKDQAIEGFDVIPAEERSVLLTSGFETVGSLAGATTKQVVEVLARDGITASPGTVAGWLAAASALIRVQ
jgi:hypothetical protein